MNLFAVVSILLGTILTFQALMINGAKRSAEQDALSKELRPLNKDLSHGTVDSADVLVRTGRKAKTPSSTETGIGKRKKKHNKGTHVENPDAPNTLALNTTASDVIAHEAGELPKQDQKNQQSTASSPEHEHNNNNKQKQKQTLRSQHHQTHAKRGGNTKPEKKSDANKHATCRYTKGAWSECDAKTQSRSRMLTLKKGESSCAATRTIQKKCKKACRYDKGAWTECTAGQMTREDKLKTGGDATCEAVRSINKKCNPGGKSKDKGNKDRKNKEKGTRKAAA